MQKKLRNLPEKIHGLTTSDPVGQNSIRYGANSYLKKEIRWENYKVDGRKIPLQIHLP